MNNNFFNDENNRFLDNEEYDTTFESEEEEEEENQFLLPEIRATLVDESYIEEYENELVNEYNEINEEEEEEQEQEQQEEPIIFDSSINNLLNILWVPPENFNLTNFSFFNNAFQPSNSLNNILSTSFENDKDIYKNVLSEEGKKQLKIIKYNSKQLKDKVCPITREEFKENEEIIQLPCEHIFSKDAIITWLETEAAICPICRKKLKSKEIKNETNNQNNTTTQRIQQSRTPINIGQTFLNIINQQQRQIEDEQLQQAIINSFNN